MSVGCTRLLLASGAAPDPFFVVPRSLASAPSAAPYTCARCERHLPFRPVRHARSAQLALWGAAACLIAAQRAMPPRPTGARSLKDNRCYSLLGHGARL